MALKPPLSPSLTNPVALFACAARITAAEANRLPAQHGWDEDPMALSIGHGIVEVGRVSQSTAARGIHLMGIPRSHRGKP